jgi:hypothetical protein
MPLSPHYYAVQIDGNFTRPHDQYSGEDYDVPDDLNHGLTPLSIFSISFIPKIARFLKAIFGYSYTIG